MVKYDFYRPHDQDDTSFKNELVDLATGEITHPPSMTKQNFVDECDINNILAEYKTSGQIRHMSAKAELGAYQDLPDGIDFQEALNTVIQGEDAFATLPSGVRARFHNDPQEFLLFMADPANQDEVIKMGLATDRRPPPPAPLSDHSPMPAKGEKPASEPGSGGGAGESPPRKLKPPW